MENLLAYNLLIKKKIYIYYILYILYINYNYIRYTMYISYTYSHINIVLYDYILHIK